ncbi:aminodeoxychorismate synthase component I [Dissulfurirhabdus thermomarina]|uniref:Aminodeoxychorismate synthase component I n=1 Tax=Dissulfurirhabdus thermomarina TaxID=1765737 RepID=A0A6N9TPX2_DISTH|nr:aminodeoxychorismate synthase component I [Dissulfurirhabdus thermomarina]NDY43332.1 aminodeoxychorismate synthase component I [Dissulfurirhabdus thermomarina]NMX22845.1 aminodeoxychorismate synthase component I [Dissulfurirhabdus thermomarina]
MEREPYVTGALYPLDVVPLLERLREEPAYVLLETARIAGDDRRSFLFRRPEAVLTASGPEDLPAFFAAVERALARGRYLAGWWAYEWGYALEPKLHGLLDRRRPAGPLAWLGVFPEPEVFVHAPDGPAFPGPVPDLRGRIGPLALNVDPAAYAEAIGEVQERIAAGETYQVNYTLKGRFSYRGDPEALYLALRAQQAVSYAAVVRDGDRWILSLSPELFLRRRGARVTTRPMKGTAGRGRTTAEDREIARRLAADGKNRAENVMIVDLLRNDIGRLCPPGGVAVPELFTVERYETLFQMTSRIDGRLRPGVSWEALLRAAFPCGSVTGAPKLRTMEIIADLEREPRGVYTGAVGYLGPGGEGTLNVAIRTVVLEGGMGEIGIGSGVTAGSDTGAEYEECRVKAAFVTRRRPAFALVETLRWDPPGGGVKTPAGGYSDLEAHLARLADSAHYFGFRWRPSAVRRALAEAAGALDPGAGPHRVRLRYTFEGRAEVTSAPLGAGLREPLAVGLSPEPVRSDDPFLFHKTTHRPLYEREAARARAAGLDECLFVNERGEVTEGTFTNLFLPLEDGRLATPPAGAGLLGGVLRQGLLAAGRAVEQALTPADLERAPAFYVGNSVRGLLRARWQGPF